MRRTGLHKLAAVLAWLGSGSVAEAQPVWLGPAPDTVTPVLDPDYAQLFEENAPWQQALSHVRVFEVPRGYILAQPVPYLQKVFNFLHSRRIELAVIFGFIPAFTSCGQDVEGAAHRPDENIQAARRVRNLGAEIKYITVDEALFWGHFSRAAHACRYSIEQLAAGFAREAQQVRSIFPNAELIETEPSSGIPSLPEFNQWLDALKGNLGAGAPKVVRFDVQWYRPWQQTVPPIIAVLREHGLSYSVIYKGSYLDHTDREYIASAQQHIMQWEATIPEQPDHVIFQNWERMAIKTLPETTPTTLTYLIDWYCAHSKYRNAC